MLKYVLNKCVSFSLTVKWLLSTKTFENPWLKEQPFSLDCHCVFSDKIDVQYWIYSLFSNMYLPRAWLWLTVDFMWKCPELTDLTVLVLCRTWEKINRVCFWAVEYVVEDLVIYDQPPASAMITDLSARVTTEHWSQLWTISSLKIIELINEFRM